MNTERDVLDVLLGSKARCRTERVVSTLALCEKRGKEKNISICFYVHKDMPGGRLPCKSAALLVTVTAGAGQRRDENLYGRLFPPNILVFEMFRL